jgi:RNA polymerase subunit RPABC4/transcription elongation factor Spt4
MAKDKACMICRRVYQGSKCPACNESPFSDNFKGEVEIFNPEESIIAKRMRINKKGRYAIKLK